MGLAVFYSSPPDATDLKQNRRKYMWYVGQKVRCVNDRFPNSVQEWGSNLPQKGEVYTIRDIRSVPSAFSGIISSAFLLEERSNPDDRLHFSPNRFIPINPSEISLEQAKPSSVKKLTIGQFAHLNDEQLALLCEGAKFLFSPDLRRSLHDPIRTTNVRVSNEQVDVQW
jgi:hypothetical protein